MSSAETPPIPEREVAQALRLRPPAAVVVRLSRRVLIALGAAAAIAVSAAVLFALHTRAPKLKARELYNTTHSVPAEGLGQLPKDYAGPAGATPTASPLTRADAGGGRVPQLGPPLPGDLGRPILEAQAKGTGSPIDGEQTSPLGQAPAADAAAQRRAQERASAVTSSLFIGGADAAASSKQPLGLASESGFEATTTTDASGAPSPAPTTAASTSQDHKLAFLSGAADAKVESAERLQTPSSPYVVQAGTVIPAALVTGIRSDLPGEITAQVTEDVADSPTGRYRLIPRGSRLVGRYDSQVAFGQSRVLLIWTRLILPDGRSIVLDRLPGADAAGVAGLRDRVDNHWRQLFGAALLSSVLGVSAEIGAGNNEDDLVRALRRGPADTLNQAGEQVVGRSLNVAPTLTVRPGFQVQVMVRKDLVLEPYGG